MRQPTDPLDESRRVLLDAGAADLPRMPWQHHQAPAEDFLLLRYALHLASGQVGSGRTDELRAGLRLLEAARSELDSLETALLLSSRAEGMTWTEIAEELGLRSAQAAQQRSRRLVERRA